MQLVEPGSTYKGYQRLLLKIGGLKKYLIEKELEDERRTPGVDVSFPMPMEKEDAVEFLHEEFGEVPKTLIRLVYPSSG